MGKELNIPGYFYESAAKRLDAKPRHAAKANTRAGQVEHGRKRPDFALRNSTPPPVAPGPPPLARLPHRVQHQPEHRVKPAGERHAFDIREAGLSKNAMASPAQPSLMTTVSPCASQFAQVGQGIGWYIEEYGIAQLSLNLTDINVTVHVPLTRRAAKRRRAASVTGSELWACCRCACSWTRRPLPPKAAAFVGHSRSGEGQDCGQVAGLMTSRRLTPRVINTSLRRKATLARST